MKIDTLLDSSVMEDVDDLEAAFSYFRPSQQEEEEEEVLREVLPKRRRDPEKAMRRHNNQARLESLKEVYARRKS